MENLTYSYSELLPSTQQLLHASIDLYFQALEELKLIHHLFNPEIVADKQKLQNFLFTFQHGTFTNNSLIHRNSLTHILFLTDNITNFFTISQGNFAMKIYNKLYLAKCLLMQVDNKLFSISN